MNFRQIEAFRTVVTSGSITHAAELLGVSQPAVSRLIADLEKNIGFDLFERQGRNIVATGEGKLLYADVNRAFVGLEEIESAADAIRSNRVGKLNIVTMPSLASRLLPELIAQFTKENPEIGIWLEVLPRSSVLQAVASGRYDLGVASSPVDDDVIDAKKLCDVQAYCVLPKNHRLADKRSVRLTDLNDERVISLARDSLFRYTLDTLFEQAGIDCRRDVQARTADAIYGLVASGVGVSIVGPDMPQELKSRYIVFKPLSPALNVSIDLLKPVRQPISRIASQFWEIAFEHAKRIAKPTNIKLDNKTTKRK